MGRNPVSLSQITVVDVAQLVFQRLLLLLLTKAAIDKYVIVAVGIHGHKAVQAVWHLVVKSDDDVFHRCGPFCLKFVCIKKIPLQGMMVDVKNRTDWF